jgi:lipopolysaccharide cholinephosphotransferase
MKKIIIANASEFFFKPKKLFHGRKIINRKKAKENILILRNILNRTNLRWGLIFGTLLGAVRENNFIAHDEDTDIFIFDEDKNKTLDLIHKFRKFGFEIIRYEKNSLLSITRDNEYIDFYFFKKTFFGRKCLDYFIPNFFFKRITKIKFINKNFPTLNNAKKYLEFQYGKNWRVPKKQAHAKPNIPWKKFVKENFPIAVKIYHSWKKKLDKKQD